MRILKTRKSKIFAVILLLIIGFLVWFFFPERDIDDSDLMPRFIDVPDADNGFFHVNFKMGDVYYPADPSKHETYRKITTGEAWDKDVAHEMVDKNKALLDAVSKAIKSKSFQMPKGEDVSTLLPYLSPWRETARLAKIKSKLLLDEGKKAEALELAAEMIEFSQKIMNSANCYISFLIGNWILDKSCQSFLELIKDEKLTREDLLPYIKRFSNKEISRETEAEISKREYLIFANTFDRIANGTFRYETIWGTTSTFGHLEFQLFFNPKSTKKLFAEIFRIAVKNSYKLYAEKESLEPLIQKWNRAYRFTANSQGKKFAVHNTMSMLRVDWQMNNSRLLCRLMPVLVALRCYKLDNGDLPDMLEQLVPDYIKTVPLDPFDEKPIRYSKEKKMLYSVGADLVDSGGASEEEIIKYKNASSRLLVAEDPTIMIEF